jgi:hypothetical protein
MSLCRNGDLNNLPAYVSMFVKRSMRDATSSRILTKL